MIAANGVDRALPRARSGFPSLRRVVRSPERWERIVDAGRELSARRCPPSPTHAALEAFLAQRREADPTRFPDLSLSVVKLLGPGEYVLERARASRRDGHFGLAVRDYTHSTAPNRRFPDLVTQRLLKAALAGEPAPVPRRRARRRSPRTAPSRRTTPRKVERQVRKSAAALLLAPRIGERFDAIVTGASPKGHLGAHPRPAGRGARRARRARASTSATACACELVAHRRRARLHRLRARLNWSQCARSSRARAAAAVS